MSLLDVLAAVGVVGGSLLVALGAIGMVRFPDVLTRMHAATKAASVGVIATTLAAAFEAGSVASVLTLLLVVVLLFLSAPLGMSLLARAAYHDPETPRSPNTRGLAATLPIPESTLATHGRGTSWPLAGGVFAAWIAVFGSLAANVVLGGLIVAGLVALAFRHLSPRWPRTLLHPIAVLRFAWHFVGQLAVSTWGVIVSLALNESEIRPAVVEIPLRARTRSEVTLLMNSISFTPGTVALELHDQYLYVHVLDTDDPDAVIAEAHKMESYIMAMFGTHASAEEPPQ